MGKLVKLNSVKEPDLVTVEQNEQTNEYIYLGININVCKLTDGSYDWDCIEIDNESGFFKVLDNIHNADIDTKYSVLITHIIRAYYNDHQMTAIVNNYLLEPENEKYVKEFNDMQKIRKLAKATAKQIIDNNLF